MEAPDGTFDDESFAIRGARLADEGAIKDALRAVEPAVRPPDEVVQGLVRVVALPAIEHDLRFAGGLGFVAILERDEE